MLHSFSAKNFYSIKDPVQVSFVVNNHAPKTSSYISKLGARLSKFETVIGANASGKTHVLKIPAFLSWFISNSFDKDPESPISVKPFKFNNRTVKEPTIIETVFELQQTLYTYSIELTEERIFNETLQFCELKDSINKKTQTSLSRTWDKKSQRYKVSGIESKFLIPFADLLRSNASFFSLSSRLNHKRSQEIVAYWSKCETNVAEIGWIGDHFKNSKNLILARALGAYKLDKKFKRKVEALLSKYDLGLDCIEFNEKVDGDTITLSDIQSKHIINGETYSLPLQYDSSGTKQLLLLLGLIIRTLELGSLAIIDEFEANLHPEIVRELFELFIHPETNPHNAQLLMSTHSHLLLRSLDKYQIVLVEKNDEGSSDVWRLDDYVDASGKPVRPDDNYFAKYIAGAYGAVPKF